MRHSLFATALVVPLLSVGLVSAAAAAIANPVSNDPIVGQHVPAFVADAIDVSGKTPQTKSFDSQKEHRVTAYIFVGTTCPTTSAYIDRFKELERTYMPKQVDFVYLYPNNNDTHDAILKFHKENQFHGRVIHDEGGKLAHLFKAQRTSEMFIADQKGTVVFHGALDDSRDPSTVQRKYAGAALDELLAGKPIAISASQVFA